MSGAREFELIARYFQRPVSDGAVRVGIGDDAAIVACEGAVAVAVDTLVAGTHFPELLPAAAVGHRALAVNLSDLAACGARPRWATLALSLPAVDPGWLEEFARGFFALAERFDVTLIGGDTTRGPLTVTVQLLGDAGAAPLLRSAGEVGDLVFVSGNVGSAAAGLHCVIGEHAESQAAAALIQCFSYPEPRVALGQALVGLAHAAIDISDGLLADLAHIGEASGCGATIEPESLPLADEIAEIFTPEQGLAFALTGGDDYELCFTAPAAASERIHAAAAELAIKVTAIGSLTAEPGIRIAGRDLAEFEAQGFRHFG